MDFSRDAETAAWCDKLESFMDQRILPAHADVTAALRRGEHPGEIIAGLKAEARQQGLWNLFLPDLRDDEPGTRMSNLAYAPLAEIMGRIPWASEVFNCSAPDTGNMELLHRFATPTQRERWLDPLLAGEIRSCIGITEPDVASSDPTNLETTIRRDGEDYVINGRKWFTTGALHPHARFVIVMGRSGSEEAEPHRRHALAIVPFDTPGFSIVRNLPLLGRHALEGHCETLYRNVRIPRENLIGGEGDGFKLIQARLGPGRIHHCMRAIGQCELALELMCERALERRTFGRPLADYANLQDWIAWSRIEIDQARLLCLNAADRMDREGARAARGEIAAIKVVAAQLQTRIADRAMQIFGAMGLTEDTPLAEIYTWGRALRFVDGPDEVHLRSIARAEIKRAKQRRGAGAAYLVPDY